MRRFTALVSALERTSSARQKTAVFKSYLTSGPDETDMVWTLHLLGGKKPVALCSSRHLKKLLDRTTDLPGWLVERCQRETGEVTETVSLLAGNWSGSTHINLSSLMREIESHSGKAAEDREEFILSAWANLAASERYLFNKIITGIFKSPLRTLLLSKCVSVFFKTSEHTVTYRLHTGRHPASTPLSYITAPSDESEKRLFPYPFPPHPREKKPAGSLGNPVDWYYYPHYKGIRCQIVFRDSRALIWTAQGELLPEYESLTTTLRNCIADNTVLDAVLTANRPQSGFYIHDLLEYKGTDLRGEQLEKRSRMLSEFEITTETALQIIPGKPVGSWEQIESLVREMHSYGAPGILLKPVHSAYPSAHNANEWLSIMADPFVSRAVLLYTEPKRENVPDEGLLCTFAVRSGALLVPFTKTARGIDKRVREIIDQYVNEHTSDRFGPVRQVRPGLVFEIAFESIEPSNRHKSGLTVSSPRVHRYLPGCTVEDIDTVESLKKLIVTRRDVE
jgi:DNA ligase 1